MKTFLEEVADKVYRDHPSLENVTVIFPNRRAALYFRKHLTGLIKRPTFAPLIITIEDFFVRLSQLQVPDKLILISTLFKSYCSVMDSFSEESDSEKITRLEDFYFWGEMLLRDFDEVDKYLVSAERLFKDLSHQKELDASFDFLTEEQKGFLRDFWSNFDFNETVNKQRFLRMWKRLPQIYEKFRRDLGDNGMAYEGMLHRQVAESIGHGVMKDRLRGEIVFPEHPSPGDPSVAHR